jgi:hypothetical protein
LLQLRWAWNRRPPQPLHDRHCLANTAASANSILPAVFAFHVRTFHAHCNAHSPDGGFSGGTTGSILTSRTTSQDSGHSPQGVLRLNWRERLFGEAGVLCHTMPVEFQEGFVSGFRQCGGWESLPQTSQQVPNPSESSTFCSQLSTSPTALAEMLRSSCALLPRLCASQMLKNWVSLRLLRASLPF